MIRAQSHADQPSLAAAVPLRDQPGFLPPADIQEQLRAERVALNARMIEAAILRLMPLLTAGQVQHYGLERGRKVIAALASQYESEARSGR